MTQQFVTTAGLSRSLHKTTCSVVVCVCVVNPAIVCEVPTWLLCGALPPREATVKREIIGRAEISHEDGKAQQQL